MSEKKIKYWKITKNKKCTGGAFVKPRKKTMVVKTIPKKKEEETGG